MTQPRGAVAPLIRRALELLPAGELGELGVLVGSRIPEAMRTRLEPGDLAAEGVAPAEAGHSALLVISGPGIGSARIGVVLHSGGGAYTLALRAEEAVLPIELSGGASGLDARRPELPAADRPGREWAASAVATLTRPAAELLDDHRWWADLGALVMLADLLMEGSDTG